MKKEKGITLVALVITIIVLLILAGVTINLTLGQNGIFKIAQRAKEEHIEAQEKEELSLKELDASIVGYTNPWTGTIGTGFARGEGTKESPYIIENGEQLAYLASQVNNGETYEGKYIKIGKSINLGNIEFTPIGIGSTGTREEKEWNMTECCFNGTLNGNGNGITGVKITQLNMHGVGIIGVLGEKGVVEDLNTYEGTVIGKTCVGGIVGASKGRITNCINKLTVIAQDDETSNSGQMAGGIVGWATKGTIENCKNYGNVTTKDDSVLTGRGKYAGGILGFALLEEDMTISNCSNSGTVIAVYQQAGGIVASAEYSEKVLTINNCKNTGKVMANYTQELENSGIEAGGIIGWAYTETNITNCTNSGTITVAKEQAGGIVGTQSAGMISNCSNSANVTANTDAGGIVGYQLKGTISNCSNSGTIEVAFYQVGGIAGIQSAGTISNCSNSGTITAADQQAGGIAGLQLSGTISDCSNSGDVSTKVGSGGIVGYMYGTGDKSITNCTNSGTITAADQQAGGIAGTQGAGIISNCSNSGEVVANAAGGRGIVGGIIGIQDGGSIANVYNSASVSVGDYSSTTVDAIGGIVGYQYGGSITKAYNKGTLTGGDAVGGVVGQKKMAPTLENTYYYTSQNIQGIGSESDTTAEITAVVDVEGKTEKTTKDIDSLDSFLKAEMP